MGQKSLFSWRYVYWFQDAWPTTEGLLGGLTVAASEGKTLGTVREAFYFCKGGARMAKSKGPTLAHVSGRAIEVR